MEAAVLEKTETKQDLATQWAALKQEHPGMRIREAAGRLGVSEAELLVTNIGSKVTRLKPDFQEILKSIEPFGEVMALSRNDHAVHERKGVYSNVSFEGKMGLVLNPDIDLRLFMWRWHHAFAVQEEARGKLRQSIQFFDKDGLAIHKIYLTDNSDASLFEPLVEKFTHEDQSPTFSAETYPPAPADRPDSEIDVEKLNRDWENLKDTHDFYDMLKKHKVGRVQALRLADDELAYQLAPSALRDTLTLAADMPCEIMIFVGNPGIFQIHSGPVHRLIDHGGFYNVLDEKFNLHAKEEAIASAWVVKKPTEDGTVTAVELYDGEGENIALLFGKRKPGNPELEAWRELTSQLPRLQ